MSPETKKGQRAGDQSYQPILPKLKTEHQVKNFNNAGKWDVREPAELEKLSAGLSVDRVAFEINSIPDMWARPILFEMALFDRDHILHKRTVGEWRGLLAMLALKEVRNISDLSVTRVQIPGPSRSAADSPPIPDFLDALVKLMPTKTLSLDTSWSDLHIILFRKEPIGMTSPTTLVCTATDCFNRIHNVPWFDGQYLEDPIPKLNDDEKKLLASWLTQLMKDLTIHPPRQQAEKEKDKAVERLWNNVLGQFADGKDGFIDHLGGIPDKSLVPSQDRLGFTKDIFIHLDKPISGQQADPYNSHVRLVPSEGKEPDTPILVVDKTIVDQWRVPEHQILV